MSIAEVFKDRGNKALKVKVVAEGEQYNFSKRGGTQGIGKNYGVSDGITYAKLCCFEKQHFNRIQVGNTILLRNVGKKMEGTLHLIMVNTDSRVFTTSPIDIDEELTRKSTEVVRPPVAELVSVGVALTSPQKTRISVRGKIIQEDAPKNVTVRQEEVTIKTITVQDSSGEIQVTLWRDLATKNDHRPGSYVELTNCLTNKYRDTTSLSTTQYSSMTGVTAPTTTNRYEIVGIMLLDGSAELLTSDDLAISVSAEMLAQACSTQEDPNPDISKLCENGSRCFEIETKGDETLSIVGVEK